MNFEEAMKEYGHQITCDISLGGKVYGEGDILSVTPHYEGALLTSVICSFQARLYQAYFSRSF